MCLSRDHDGKERREAKWVTAIARLGSEWFRCQCSRLLPPAGCRGSVPIVPCVCIPLTRSHLSLVPRCSRIRILPPFVCPTPTFHSTPPTPATTTTTKPSITTIRNSSPLLINCISSQNRSVCFLEAATRPKGNNFDSLLLALHWRPMIEASKVNQSIHPYHAMPCHTISYGAVQCREGRGRRQDTHVDVGLRILRDGSEGRKSRSSLVGKGGQARQAHAATFCGRACTVHPTPRTTAAWLSPSHGDGGDPAMAPTRTTARLGFFLSLPPCACAPAFHRF